MNTNMMNPLGPLAALAGIWEGSKGDDIAPADDRTTENNKYRERMTFEPFGPVNNHEQTLWGLKYATTAWRIGEDSAFHEEVGYWLWDAQAKQVLRCFLIPRGVTLLAGGTVEPDAKQFELNASVGSETYGICSNLFLDKEFKTMRYQLKVNIHPDGSFTYQQTTFLKMKGQEKIFEHTDENTMRRVKA